MRVLIPTIRHSGSHLCLDAFLGYGFEQAPVKNYNPAENAVTMDHVLYSKVDKMLDIAQDADAVVIPVRHPRLIMLSWGLQGEDLNPDFFQMLHDLKRFAALPNAIVLPLGPDVDNSEQVAAIKEVTGVLINTSRPTRSIAGTWDKPNDTKEVFQHAHINDVSRMDDMELDFIMKYYTEADDGSQEEVIQEAVVEEKPKPKAKAKAKASPSKAGSKKPAAAKKEVVDSDEQKPAGGLEE